MEKIRVLNVTLGEVFPIHTPTYPSSRVNYHKCIRTREDPKTQDLISNTGIICMISVLERSRENLVEITGTVKHKPLRLYNCRIHNASINPLLSCQSASLKRKPRFNSYCCQPPKSGRVLHYTRNKKQSKPNASKYANTQPPKTQ